MWRYSPILDMMGVSVRQIRKKYKKVVALEGISFELDKGEIFGLIGPDGAGKSTLMRILTTVLLPDSGEATVDGFDLADYRQIRKRVGYMPGRFSLYQDLTVEENLRFFATIFGTTLEENYHLVKDIYVQLEPFRKRRAGQLSGGMKQKLALCCALIHQPTVLFLDEPTTGVDPVSRAEFWDMLERLKEQEISILVSTPYKEEASRCDRIGLIQNGRMLKVDSPAHIIGQFRQKIYAIRSDQPFRLLQDLKKYPDTLQVYPFGEYLHFLGKDAATRLPELQQYLENLEHRQIEISSITPDLEDCFIALMQEDQPLTHTA